MLHYDVDLSMEETAIDLMAPFSESKDSNKYVLVLVDSFSQWMVFAVPNIKTKTIAKKLVMEFISHFGIQVQVKSDRGKQFDCDLFRNMCQLLDIDFKISTPFHPQGTPESKEW